jgi:hypothetical protein
MEKKQIVLPSKIYEGSPEENLTLRINFDTSQNLLREGDRNVILDLNELFGQERNDCLNYKIYGKIRMVFKNSYSGTSGYSPLKRNLYLVGDGSDSDFTGYIPYNEFAFLRKDVLREKNIPLSGSTPGSFTPDIKLTTDSIDHLPITPSDAPYKNWNFYISYVFSGDSSFPMKYTFSNGTFFSFNSGDGIVFRVSTVGKYYRLTSPVPHGMSSSEYITILDNFGGTLSSSVNVTGRTFYIDSVGNEVYNSENYVLDILKSQFTPGTTLSAVVLGKRCLDITDINNTTSKYYVHKHKTLTSTEDYILDIAGFESPIFEDEKKLLFQNSARVEDFLVERNRMESVLYDFKSPLTISGITNNFGYTPTDLYITTIFRNDNGYFNYPPKVGFKFNFHDTWLDRHFSGTTSLETTMTSTPFIKSGITFNRGNALTIGTVLTGAFVEYNRKELKERIISESYHKITSPITGSTVPLHVFDHDQSKNSKYPLASVDNLAGLFYQPHHRVKIRQLSPYIETSKTDDIYGLPENVIYDESENLWKWRDLYDHGYIDPDGFGTNFPFLNNTHYIKMDIDLYLRNESDYKNKTDGFTRFKNIKIDC